MIPTVDKTAERIKELEKSQISLYHQPFDWYKDHDSYSTYGYVRALEVLDQSDSQPKNLHISDIDEDVIERLQRLLTILTSKSLISLKLDLNFNKEIAERIAVFLQNTPTLLSLDLSYNNSVLDIEAQSILFAAIQKSSVIDVNVDYSYCREDFKTLLFPLLRKYLPNSKIVTVRVNHCRFEGSAENFLLLNDVLQASPQLMELYFNINNPDTILNICELKLVCYKNANDALEDASRIFLMDLKNMNLPKIEDYFTLKAHQHKEISLKNMAETLELLESVKAQYFALGASSEMLRILEDFKKPLQKLIAINVLEDTLKKHPSLQYLDPLPFAYSSTKYFLYSLESGSMLSKDFISRGTKKEWEEIFAPILPKELSALVRSYRGVKDARLTQRYNPPIGILQPFTVQSNRVQKILGLKAVIDSPESWEYPVPGEQDPTPVFSGLVEQKASEHAISSSASSSSSSSSQGSSPYPSYSAEQQNQEVVMNKTLLLAYHAQKDRTVHHHSVHELWDEDQALDDSKKVKRAYSFSS